MSFFVLFGCSSVQYESAHADKSAKEFSAPSDKDTTGVYIYRDSSMFDVAESGLLLVNFVDEYKVYIDDKCVGNLGDGMYIYVPVDGNKTHVVETDSEFGRNKERIYMKAGENIYIRQYLKMGVVVAGAGIEVAKADEAKKIIKDLKMVSSSCQ